MLLTRILVFFSVLTPFFTTAQPKRGQARIDSLLTLLPAMKEDSTGAYLLDEIAYAYDQINPAEHERYAIRELRIAEKIGFKKGTAKAYISLGHAKNNVGNYPAALEYFFKALDIYEETKNDRGISIAYLNIGLVYGRQSKDSMALDYYGKSLRYSEATGNKNLQQMAIGNSAGIFITQEKYDQAEAYLGRALELSETLDDKQGIIIHTGNMGLIKIAQKEYGAGIAYYLKSLRMAESIDARVDVARNKGNMGEAYLLVYKDSSYSGPDSLIPASKPLQLASAIRFLNEGISESRDCGAASLIPTFAKALSEALKTKGDFPGALAAYEQYVSAHDSLFNTENSEKVAALETRRVLELKDKDIRIAQLAVAKRRNERGFFIAGIVLLLGVVGLLLRSFRKQKQSNVLLFKEKARSDDLLRNILPDEVAEELKDHGSSAARQYDEVSVLFTDFVDFTGTAQKLSPQALVQELNACFTAFDAIMERNGLEKIKTIGDAYMAVCGLPQSDERHAQRTVQAALEIRAFIETRLAEAFSEPAAFQIRIGVNSGPVVAGIVGVKKFAYDIWGDTVNTAARMEQHSEPGKINISQSTYELVRDEYRCDSRGKLEAKNKGEIAMYFLEAPTGFRKSNVRQAAD